MATMYYRPYTAEPRRDDELPSHDALASILPDYHYIFIDPDAKKKSPKNVDDSAEGPSRSEDTDSFKSSELGHRTADGKTTLPLPLMEYHLRELDNYRTAIHKMGQDLLTLREKLRTSEIVNSQLRSDLSHYDDATKLIMDSTELDGLSKPELAARYASLKKKLSSQTAELKAYKDKVCHLQNEIIQKNDEAKDFLSIRNAHQLQQSTIHQLQERAKKSKKLEDTCQKQEKVIEKLEQLVKKSKNNKKNDFAAEAQEALLAENKRVREELSYLQEQLKISNGNDRADDIKTLELHQALEKADGRIIALEKQMDVNARQWGRERADLMLKLQESKRGFKPTLGISDPQTGRFLEPYKPVWLKNKSRPKTAKSMTQQ